MQQIRYTLALLLVSLLISGCTATLGELSPTESYPTLDFYHLHISFKNSAGNDMLEQLAYYKSDPSVNKYWGEVDPEQYSLKIMVSSYASPEESYFTMAKFDGLHSWMTADKNGRYGHYGTWYLTSNFSLPSRKDGSPYSPLRYLIYCPSIFGSIYYHELVTWWEEGTIDETNGLQYPACVRATLDGKEIKPVKGLTYNINAELYYVGYFLDIIIDR